MSQIEKWQVQLGDRGRLVLPAAVRARLELEPGDWLLVTLEPDESLRVRSARSIISRGRGLFRDIAPERSLVDELLQERREEAAREEGDGTSHQARSS